MKKVMVLLVLVLILCSSSVMAAEGFVKANPLGLILGTFNVEYEKASGDMNSLFFGGNFYSYDADDWKISGFGIEAGKKYYTNELFSGAYYGPRVGYSSASFDYKGSKDDTSRLFVGGRAGYQWLTKNNMAVDLNIGGNYYFGDSVKILGEEAPLLGEGFGLTLGLSVGFGF